MKRILIALVVIVALSSSLEAAFRTGRYTVTTTATAFYTAPPRGGSVVLCNRHTESVYLGGDATLTTANGFELKSNDCTTQTPAPRESIWMIVAAATARVDWAEGAYPR